MSIFTDLAVIVVESQTVISKRLFNFASGGASSVDEATLMVREKAELALISGLALAGGQSMESVVKRYREAVEANVRRLSEASI